MNQQNLIVIYTTFHSTMADFFFQIPMEYIPKEITSWAIKNCQLIKNKSFCCCCSASKSDSLQPHAVCQATLSSTVSGSLLKFMCIQLVMLTMLTYALLSPFPFAFNISQNQSFLKSLLFLSSGQSFGPSTLASILPMNSQG